jgi:hypothetical protein
MVLAWIVYVAVYVWVGATADADTPLIDLFVVVGVLGIFVLPIVGIVLGRRAVRLGERVLGKRGIVGNALTLAVFPAFFIFLVVLVSLTGGVNWVP